MLIIKHCKVNTIWPIFPIWTAATQMIAEGQQDIMYKPSIMSDAAYTIIIQGTDFTGNFTLDQEILMEKHGITDFTDYQVNPEIDSTTFSTDYSRVCKHP